MTMCISEALSMPIEFDSMHHRDAGVQNEKSDATAYSPASTSSQSDFCFGNDASAGSPPSYSSSPSELSPAKFSGKKRFLGGIFSSKKQNALPSAPPSYRDTEVRESWAKAGVDINDRSQGPLPQCTPDEWLQAMDGLFGLPQPRK